MKRPPKTKNKPSGPALIGAQRKTETVGEMIQSLRKEKNLTQKTLSEELGVSRETVNVWEKGTRLPAKPMLAKLGKLTPNSEHRREFFKQATSDASSELGSLLRAEITKDWDEALPGQIVVLPVLDGDSEKPKRLVPYPAGRLLHPIATFCLEIGHDNSFLPGLLQEGDLAVIDGAQTELMSSPGALLAAKFEVIPNLQPPSWAGQSNAERQWLARRNNSLSEEEKAFNKPGVRFGWPSLVNALGGPAEPDQPWCFVLEPAKVRAMSESGRPLQLTGWQTGTLPSTEAELEKYLQLKQVRILGTVIGWIGALR